MLRFTNNETRPEAGRRMARARWSNSKREPDIVVRSLAHGNAGKPIAECYTNHNGQIRHLLIRWSLRGRINQWDSLIDGRLKDTCGKREMLKRWPCIGKIVN